MSPTVAPPAPAAPALDFPTEADARSAFCQHAAQREAWHAADRAAGTMIVVVMGSIFLVGVLMYAFILFLVSQGPS